MIINQFNYGFCFKLYCLQSAFPKVTFISFLISIIVFYISNESKNDQDHEKNNFEPTNVEDKLTSNTHNSTIWYGKGIIGTVIFDKTIQTSEEYVLLYVLEENNVKKYLKEEVRQVLQEEKNIQKIEELSEKYQSWTKFYSSTLKKIALSAPCTPENPITPSDPKQNHKNRLNKLGLPFNGITAHSNKKHRATNCYLCKNLLDNTIDLECNSCGWILCKCGACGCGYGK